MARYPLTTRSSALLAVLLVFVVVLVSPALSADQPLLEVEFETSEVIPGQSLPLRLTVLVPSWMPKPVDFPSFEMPNVRVRLPGRSTFPTSRRVGRETWSGVVRTYYLTPLVPGVFEFPPQTLTVTYAEPGGIDPVVAQLQTDALILRGVVPEGAESLNPFIAATSLTLEQEVSATTTNLAPGDSIQRTITARIEGASPFSLPRLLPDHDLPGIRGYPDQPVVEESDEGSALSGSRTERIALMAEGGGSGEAPEIILRWYNLETGSIETSRVAGFDVSVIAPPPPPAPPDYGKITRMGLMALVAASVIFWVFKRIWPPIGRVITARRQCYLVSEPWAFSELRGSIQSQDYAGTLANLETWSRRISGADPLADDEVRSGLDAIGRAQYSTTPRQVNRKTWGRLYASLLVVRSESQKRSSRQAEALPQLNP